jgi:photosystem II stability/assembly factor-like uncharacterized protein
MNIIILIFAIVSLLPNQTEAQSSKAGEGAIFFSKDMGETWKRMDKGLPQKAIINDFAFTKGIILAGTEAHGLFLSTDNLNSWQASNNGLPPNVKIDAVEVFENKIILGSNKHGIFISNDNGKSWYASNDGLKNLTVRCLHTSGMKILAGTNDGIHISTDKAKSWKQVFPNEQINGFTSLNGKIYAGFTKGVLLSANNGEIWKSILYKSAVHNISNDGEYVFAMCYGPSVLKTKDDGINWIKSDTGLPNLYTFQIENIGYRLIAGQWDGIYKSDDHGQSWSKSSRGLPTGCAFKELLITEFGIITGRQSSIVMGR